MAGARRGTARTPGLLLILVTLGSAVYVARSLHNGWVPHDEGALAQSAERVLGGALPHRDFGDPYTGGLSAIGAVAFRLFGVRLTVLRDVMFATFVLSVPPLFLIATSLMGPWTGAAVTALAVVWSVPNYPAAMPSWYNLFLAILSLAAYIRFLETGRRRWLVAAGFAAGLSIAVKIVGVYLVLALLLGLVYREQARDSAGTASDAPDRTDSHWYAIGLTSALLVLPVALVALVRSSVTPAAVVHFVLPCLALVSALLVGEWRGAHAPSASRARHLLHLIGPLLAGVCIPLIVLVTPYIAAHAIHPLVADVLVRASQRLRFATLAPPGLRSAWPALVVGAILIGSSHLPVRWQWLLAGVAGPLVVVAGAIAPLRPAAYGFVWGTARIVIPLTVVYGCLLLATGDWRRDRRNAAGAERLFIILSVTAWCSLVQFPFSAPNYWCYVAPLAVLAIVAVQSVRPRRVGPVGALLALAFLLFGITRVNGQSLASLGVNADPGPVLAPLDLERAGLRVPTDDKETYEELVGLVRRHVGPSGYAYAGPDAPEVTFLAGLRDPTMSLFDFLDDSTTHVATILAALRQHDVRVVALQRDPEFSPLDPRLDSTLRRWYPEADTVGSFDVRWR